MVTPPHSGRLIPPKFTLKGTVTPPHTERLIPPKFTLKGIVTPPYTERLIPPKFTLPVDLSTKQRGIDTNAVATAEPSSEYIVLPEPHIWDTIVLGIQITVIAFFALSAWIGIFFIHTLFTYTIFLSVVTAIIASILASQAYRRAYMQRVKQDACLCTQTIPALRKDTWGHLRVVTVDTFSHLAAIGRYRH
jgi:hypothetical protein